MTFGIFNISLSQQTNIDSLKAVLTSSSQYSDKVDLHLVISDYYNYTNIDSVLHYAISAKLIAEESSDKAIMMKCSYGIMNTALELRKQRKFEAAEKLIIICIDLREKAGNETSTIAGYINLCISCCNHRKYDDGIKAGMMAKEISLKYLDSPDSSHKADALSGLGSSNYWLGQIFYEKGEYYNAIKFFTESVKYRNIMGNYRTLAQSLTGLARIYVQQKKYPEAISCFDSALALYQKFRLKTGIFRALRGLGNIYELQEDYSQALSYYNKTFFLQREYKAGFEKHITCQMLGNLYIQIYHLPEDRVFEAIPSIQSYGIENACLSIRDSAEYYFSIAYESSKHLGDDLIMIRSLLGLAEISFARKEFKAAISQLNEAIFLAQKIEAKPELYKAYHILSVISEKLGRFEDALNYFKLYEIIKDSVYNEESTRQIADLHYKLKIEKKDQENELLHEKSELQQEKLNRQADILKGSIIIVSLLIIIGFMIFRSQHLRKKLEKQAAIMDERNRISADLHDDIGTGLSKISLLGEFVRTQAELPETKKEATKIADTSRELLQNISEIIWGLNSKNDYVDNLAAYIRRYAAEYFENLPLKFKTTLPAVIPRLPISGERRRNIFFTVKEAMNNIVKHARATKAELIFSIKNDVLFVVIQDNGIGIPEGKLNQFGNGLKNMHKRMSGINGSIKIETNAGTKITLALPI